MNNENTELWKSRMIWARKQVNKVDQALKIALDSLPVNVRKDVEKHVFFYFDYGLFAGCLDIPKHKEPRVIIFISNQARNQEKNSLVVVMLHEIAHYFLKHKDPLDISIKEIEKEEKEAWDLAFKWEQKYSSKKKR